MSKAGQQIIAGAKQALRMVQDMKPADSRPQRFGWAPGAYMCKCFRCDCHFIGDKRAVNCADCAYSPDAAPLWE